MRRILIALAMAALVLPSPVSGTWSIIAIDRATGRMVISSATCAATRPNQLKQLQAIVIPGVGVAAAQAGVWLDPSIDGVPMAKRVLMM